MEEAIGGFLSLDLEGVVRWVWGEVGCGGAVVWGEVGCGGTAGVGLAVAVWSWSLRVMKEMEFEW